MSISSCREYLEHTVLNGQKRNVKRAPAKIIDEDLRLSVLLVQPVGQSGCSRLVDYAENLETGDRASILGSLSLCVIEVWRNLVNGSEGYIIGRTGRDGDHSLRDLLSKEGLSSLLHSSENHGGYLLRSLGTPSERLLVTDGRMTHKVANIPSMLDFDDRLASLVNYLERPVSP